MEYELFRSIAINKSKTKPLFFISIPYTYTPYSKLTIMKNVFKSLYVTLFLAVVFSSCSKPKNLEVVPKDSQMVATMDAASLAIKGDLIHLSDLKMIKMLKQEAQNEDQETSEMMNDLITNPFSTGISLTQDVFAFSVSEGDEVSFVCLSLEMSDKENFSAFLQKLFARSGTPFAPEQKEKYTMQKVDTDDIAIAWDDDKILVCVPINEKARQQLESKVYALMTLPNDQNILTNSDFMDFYKNKKDVSVWLGYDLLSNAMSQAQQLSALAYDMEDFAGTYMAAYVDFQDDAINFSSQMYPSEILAKKYSSNPPWGAGFNSDLLNTLPEQHLAILSASVNTSYISSMLKDIPQMSQAEAGLQAQLGVGIDEVIKSFKGNIAMSLNTVKTQQRSYYDYTENIEKTKDVPMPVASMVLDLNSREILDKVKALVPPTMMREKAGYFEIPMGAEDKFFLFYDDKTLFATNDEINMMAVAAGKEIEGNLSGSSVGKLITKNQYYANAKINLEDYPTIVQNMVSEQGGMINYGIVAWNSLFKSFELKQNQYSSEFIINLVENDQNSLAHIIATIDDNASAFGGM